MTIRIVLGLFAICHAASAYVPVIEFNTGQAADSVLGQADFTTATADSSAASLSTPRGVAMDPTTNKLYVSDRDNNRVLRFSSTDAYLSGANAEQALGQAATTGGTFSVVSATSMFHPGGLAFDSAGRLYVADTGNNRVLRFDAPSATNDSGIAASAVFGQPDMTTATAATTASGMDAPTAVAVGMDDGFLWVADTGNNRVIGFPTPANAANGAAATRALGQSALDKKDVPATPAAESMNAPEGVVTDNYTGTIFVSDTGNHRVLRFAANPDTGAAANLVLGQPDFTTGDAPVGVTAANLYYPEGLALDTSGPTSLWVTDRTRGRVLRFDNATSLTNGANAAIVLGQSSLTAEGMSTTQRGLSSPYALALDTRYNFSAPHTLWIADSENNRVLRFTPTPRVPPPPRISGARRYTTRKATIVVSGKVWPANIGYSTIVSYEDPTGDYSFAATFYARGSYIWVFKARCKIGRNRFTVIASDIHSRKRSAPLVVTVVRRK